MRKCHSFYAQVAYLVVYVACMLKIPISLVFKGVFSEIRVRCASFVSSILGLLGFASQYLWF